MSRLTQAARQLHTKVRFGLTGTLLQNHMMELWCTMDWAVPNCLGESSIFKNDYQDTINRGRKQTAAESALLLAQERTDSLNRMIELHVLRREKSLIADQMPRKEDMICICPMSEQQSEIYDRVLNMPEYTFLRDHNLPCTCGSKRKRTKCCFSVINPEDCPNFYLDPEREHKMMALLFPALTQLLKVCNHLDLIRYSRKDKDEARLEKDRMFAIGAFGTDEESVIAQQDNMVVLANDRDCGKMQVLTGCSRCDSTAAAHTLIRFDDHAGAVALRQAQLLTGSCSVIPHHHVILTLAGP